MELSKYQFRKLKEYVEEDLDFSISYYNDDYLTRRLKSRMRRTGHDSLKEYFKFLRNNEQEQEDLLQSLSINVTGFFRNIKVWKRIRELLREKSSEGECRVWSAGCADGREAYSIALLALEDNQIDESNVEVYATDINQEALKRAKEGIYKNTITNKVFEELSFLNTPKAYIQQDGDHIQISEKVREMVTFEEHDLIRDRAPHWFDIVLCRNVLIYLKNDHEEDIFQTISSATNEGGYIIIGKVETLPSSLKEVFRTVDPAMRVYQYTGY